MKKDRPPIIEGDFTVIGEPPPSPPTRRERVVAAWDRFPQPVKGILGSFQVWWLIAVVLLVGTAAGWY